MCENISMDQIEIMEQNGYWHYCEVCGKKEFLTSSEAFKRGWDYPGKYGIYQGLPNFGFKILAPRTCGQCSIVDTVYYRITVKKMDCADASKEDLEILNRILNEPTSLTSEN